MTVREAKKFLILQLQDRLVPFFCSHGFHQAQIPERDRKSREMRVSLPLGSLKRFRGQKLDIIDIQIHSQKAAFVLNFGVAPPEGVKLPNCHLGQDEVRAESLLESCRLYQFRPLMLWFGFSYLPVLHNPNTLASVAVERAIRLYSEVEEYFLHGTIGRHVKCLQYRFDPQGRPIISIRSS